MTNALQNDSSIGHYLVASGMLGGYFALILTFGEAEHEAEHIVGYVCLFVQLLACIGILYACIAMNRRRNDWIKEKRRSTVIITKVVVLWIFGFAQCFLHVVYDNLRLNCGDIYILLSQNVARYNYIVFTFLQTLFISYCSQYTFFDSWKMRYIISLLTISNLFKWLEANIFSIFVKTSSNISNYYETMQNCSYIKENNLEWVFRVTDMLLTPLLMEFSILAATLIFGLSLSGNSRNPQHHLDRFRGQPESYREAAINIQLSRKHKLTTVVIGTILNAPFVFYAIMFTVDEHLLVEMIFPWLLSILGAKIVIFFLILIAFHIFHRILQIQIENRHLNFDSAALILCSCVVSLSGVVNFLFPHGRNLPLITFHTWFNVIYTIYQTIFILFGTSVEIRRGDPRVLTTARVIVITLISYNLLYWMKDSLFFQRSIENDTRNNFIRTIFFVLYPFQSFYRFQSAMELLLLYSKLCAPHLRMSHHTLR